MLVFSILRSAAEQKVLLGHSGPVYGLSFNEGNSFLVSSSEDGTGMLSLRPKLSNLALPSFQIFTKPSILRHLLSSGALRTRANLYTA